MFYERFLQLCQAANTSPSAAATKAGFNRGTVSVWKKKFEAGQDVVPEQEIVNKICAFFDCTEPWLRGISVQTENAPTLEGERPISDAELKFALWGDSAEIDDTDLDDVKRYAAFVRERKKGQEK